MSPAPSGSTEPAAAQYRDGMGDEKTERFTFRLSAAQLEKLKKIAEAEGRSAGNWICAAIEARYDELRKEKRIKK